MRDKKRGIKKFFVLFIIFLALYLIPTTLFGEQPGIKPENISESQAKYVLRVKGNFISLKAKDASLKDILEEIGRMMKIDVVANIPSEQKITIELDMIYLEDALKRFKTNYAYIAKKEKRKGNITKIVAVPKGGQQPLSIYNPQPPMQKFDYNPQPTTVRSDHESKSSLPVTEAKSPPSSTDMKNRSKPSSTVTESESQSSSAVTEDDTQPSIK